MIKKFTKEQADQFTFYRIPKELFTNPEYKKISADAKILYGLLLDRNSLSRENGWFDKVGYVYIYFFREEVMDLLGVAKEKVTRLFAELREVELIEEVRQGLGKPNIIYVGDFVTTRPEKSPQGIENTKKFENQTSGNLKIKPQEIRKSNANNTERNYTEGMKLTHTQADTNELKNATKTEVKAEKKIVCVDTPIILQEEKVHTPILEIVDNKHTLEQSVTNTPSNSTETKRKVRCIDNISTLKDEKPSTTKTEELEKLQREIKKVTGQQLSIKKISELLTASSLERIKFHLDNWHIHKEYQKCEGAGWLITVIEKDITLEKKKTGFTGEKGKVPQRDNFEQREYTREYLESFYTDLTIYMEPVSETQEAKPYTYINE